MIWLKFIGTGHDAGSEGRSLTILVEVKRNQLPQMDPELVGVLRKQAEQMIPKFPHLPKAANGRQRGHPLKMILLKTPARLDRARWVTW